MCDLKKGVFTEWALKLAHVFYCQMCLSRVFVCRSYNVWFCPVACYTSLYIMYSNANPEKVITITMTFKRDMSDIVGVGDLKDVKNLAKVITAELVGTMFLVFAVTLSSTTGQYQLHSYHFANHTCLYNSDILHGISVFIVQLIRIFRYCLQSYIVCATNGFIQSILFISGGQKTLPFYYLHNGTPNKHRMKMIGYNMATTTKNRSPKYNTYDNI